MADTGNAKLENATNAATSFNLREFMDVSRLIERKSLRSQSIPLALGSKGPGKRHP